MTTYSKETAIYKTGAIASDIADAKETAQYVWHTATDTGAGAGLHITQIPETEFIDDPDNGGMNMLLQSEAQIFRNGLTARAIYGVDGTTLLTPDGAEAFRISASSGTSTETFTEIIATRVMTSHTFVFTALDDVATDYPIQLAVTLLGSGASDTADFIKGTSSTETLTERGSTTTIQYDGDKTFQVTAGSAGVMVRTITYTKSTPTPEITIRGNILTNGFVYTESKFVAFENQRPTSNFPASPEGTISLNGYDGEYDAVEIYYRHSTSDDRVYCVRAEVGTRTPLNVQGQQYNRTGGRIATVNSNNIEFSSASYNTSTNNSYAIPLKVVCIKYI